MILYMLERYALPCKVVEAASDVQKFIYRQEQKNDGHWCDEGLWKFSRHPNYAGEIVIWCSLWAIGAISVPEYALWTIASPCMTMLLLLKVSGVPLLEKKHDEKYGGDPEYIKYKECTGLLFPKFTAYKEHKA